MGSKLEYFLTGNIHTWCELCKWNFKQVCKSENNCHMPIVRIGTYKMDFCSILKNTIQCVDVIL